MTVTAATTARAKRSYEHDCKTTGGNSLAIVYVIGQLEMRGYRIPYSPSEGWYNASGLKVCVFARRLLVNRNFWRTVRNGVQAKDAKDGSTNLRDWLRINVPCAR